MRVKYVGPARSLSVDGKEYKPGDELTLSEERIRALSRAPIGHGIHQFDIADEPAKAPAKETAKKD